MLFKQISVLFALCLVSQSLSSAELTEREDGITWRYEILGDGYIQILGTGVKDSYAQRDLEGTLVIPNSLNRYVVCSIGSSAFNDYNKITELVIPDSVTNIASRAFYSCNVLASVRLPTSLRSIGSEAFRYCGQLKTAAIPTGVRQIGNNAFRGTKVQGSLRFDEPDITIGDYAFYETSVVNMRCGARAKIGSSAFYGCNALTGVSVGAKSSIGSYAFSMCSQLVSIEFPYDVAEIGVGAFSRNDLLEEVLFHGNVDALGEEAFSMCMDLKRVDFIGDVGTIGDYSFLGDECLESVSFASNVCEVGSYAFAYCSALSSCELPHTTESLGVAAFQDCIALTSFVVPSNVTEVSDAAFSGCSSLSSVTFHDDIIRIGVAAFEDCESLLVLSLPRTGMEVCQEAFVRTGYWNAWDATVPIVVADGYFLGIKGVCEGMLDLRLIDCVSYPQGALHGQVKLTELYLPTNVPMSVAMCSGCEALETVHFPTNLTEIPARAFEGCAALESFELPKTLRLIGDSAFAGCSSIETLALNDGLTTIGKQAFRDCSKITSLEIPTSVTQIGSDAFRGCSLIQHYKGSVVSSLRDICPDAYLNIADVTLPEGATTLAANAFADCSALSDISLPTTLKSIGANAFAKCVALTSIDIPPAVTALPDDAFNGCAALTTFAFTTNYVSIGKRCFKNCHALQGLDIPYTVKTIGEAAFEGCSFDSISIPAVAVMAQVFPDTYEEIATLSVPSGCTQVAAFAFSNLTALASVDLPKTVKTLGIGAFYGCSGMAAVSIPDAVSVLPDDAFNGCTGLLDFEFTTNHVSIGKRCFKDCSSMTDLSVSHTVKTIGEAAFEGCSFDSISIPAVAVMAQVFPDTYEEIATLSVPFGCTQVAAFAFSNLTALASVDLPKTVKTLGTGAFYGCSGMAAVSIPDAVSVLPDDAFNGCTGLLAFEFTKNHISIGKRCFKDCSSMTDLSVSYTVKTIGEAAFEGCSFDSITIPPCTSLAEVFPDTYRTIAAISVPSGVTSVARLAYTNFTSLASIAIPVGVTEVGTNAFWGCVALSSVELPYTLKSLGANAFLMCTNVTSAVAPMVIPLVRMFPETYHRTDFTLQMPVGMTEICAGAFSNCFWMTTFEIPYTVTTIGANAFDGCSFETIVVPERVSNVGAKAFANNGKLKAVKYLGNRPESAAEDAYYGTEVDMVSLHLVHRTGWEDGKSAWLSRDVATYDTDEYVVYFITFMMGYEGGPVQDPVKQDYISGRPYENVPVPTRPYPFGGNYRFLGWYTQPDGLGGEKIDTSSPVSFEGTCYPHWGRPFCAYVGETGYETLQEAFDAVAISNVVSFGGSLTNPGEVVTNLAGAVIGKPCALDLQGRSLIHFSDDCLFHVCSGAEFVISNGVVVCITNAGPALKVTEHSIARMSNVSLSQDSRIGATVSATDGSSLFFSGACVVESGNTDLSARGTAISLDSTSELIISNGLYYGAIDLTEPPLQSGQVSIVGGKFSNDPSSFLSSLRKAVYLDGEEMFEVRPAGWAGVSVGGEIPQALEELGLTDEAAKTVLRNYPPYYFNEFCEWALDGATTDAEIAEKLGPVRASQNVIRAFVLDDRDLLTAPPLTSANLRVDSFEMDPHGGASTLVLSFPGVAVGTRIRHELLGDVIETEGTSDLSAGFSSSNVTLSGFAVGGGNVQVEISPKNASTAFFYRVKLK